MANIANLLTAIKNAVYGEDVREAIHDGIEIMNNEVEDVKNVQTELASNLNACNEKATMAVNTAALIGVNDCEYTFLSSRKPLYNNGENNPSSVSNSKIKYYIPLYNSYGVGDYSGTDGDDIRKHKESWYCFQALYGSISSQDQTIDCPFDQLVVENCVNLTENSSATEFDDVFTLPAVKDVMTRYYLWLPASESSEYCTMYVCDAFSTDSSHILAELRINKNTQISCGTAWRGVATNDKNKQFALTPMISFQNAIIDLQA